MEKNKVRAEIAKGFGGNLAFAKILHVKIEGISKIINELDEKASEALTPEDAKKIKIVLAKSYGELFTEILMPIYYKFHELDKYSKQA